MPLGVTDAEGMVVGVEDDGFHGFVGGVGTCRLQGPMGEGVEWPAHRGLTC